MTPELSNLSSFPAMDSATVEQTRQILPDRFSLIVQFYLKDTEQAINEINTAVTTKNIKAVNANAHKIKSSANQVGALKVGEAAKLLEHKAKATEAENPDDNYLSQIRNYADALSSAFAESAVLYKKFL